MYLSFFISQREVEGDAVAPKVEVNPKFFQLLINGHQQLRTKPQHSLAHLLTHLKAFIMDYDIQPYISNIKNTHAFSRNNCRMNVVVLKTLKQNHVLIALHL